jgi:hypothetical protein
MSLPTLDETPTRRRAGRRPGARPAMKVVQIVIPIDVRALLERLADERQTTVSAVGRRILETALTVVDP